MNGLESPTAQQPLKYLVFPWAQVMALKLSSAVGAVAAPGPMLPEIPGWVSSIAWPGLSPLYSFC